jgi:hypothetical protein
MQVGEETVNGFFPMTEPVIGGPAARIMSLRDGSKKMSKSDPSDLSRINLTDDADTISKKIKKAKTDPDALPSEVDGLAGRPEAENLVGIYAGLADIGKEAVLRQFGGQQFSVFKPALADLAVDKLSPIAAEMRRMIGRPRLCRRRAARRRRARRRLAETTMKDVRDIVGLLQATEAHRRPCGQRKPVADCRVPFGEMLTCLSMIAARFSAVLTGATRIAHGIETPQPGSRPSPQVPGDHRRNAGMRARRRLRLEARESTGGVLVLLYVIEPSDFQHWLGCGEDHARGGAADRATRPSTVHAAKVRETLGIEPELVVRRGQADRADPSS